MNIGTTIYTLRTLAGIKQKDLCRGLCSTSNLSRIESGNYNVDRLLFDALIQRLGKSPDKYEYFLGKREHQIYEKRKKITDAYEDGNEQLATDELAMLGSLLKDSDMINRQFISKMKFLLSNMQMDLSMEEAIGELLTILRITVPEVTIGKLNSYYLSLEELRIYFLIGDMYLGFHDVDSSGRIFIEILDYLETRYSDKEELLKLYPQVVYQLGLLYEEEGEYVKLISICKKGISLLVENICIYFLPELLHLQVAAMKRLGYEAYENGNTEYSRLQKQAECLDEIIQEYSINDKPKKGNHIHGSKQNRIKRVYLINEMIRRQRELRDITQDELSEGICVVENMSRIEIGKKTPNMKNYHLIMERLGQSRERYQSGIDTEDYGILEKERSMSLLIAKFQYREAEKLFLEISSSISKELPQNRQYLILTKAIIDRGLNRISDQEKLEQCEEALSYTISSYKRGELDFVKGVFSYNEITLVSNMARTYKNMGDLKTATSLLREMLKAYKKLKAGIEYHIGGYTFLLSQYASDLGLLGQYWKAIAAHNEVLHLGILYGYGNYIGASLYGISWNLLKVDKGYKETCKRLCRQAYTIFELLNTDFLRDWLKDQYLEVFGEEIINQQLFLDQAY